MTARQASVPCVAQRPENASGKRTRRVAWVVGSVLLLAATACAQTVTRITHGAARQERAITPEAYAAFARANLAERAGDLEAARKGYAEVIRNDAGADEAWIRLFALDCRVNPNAAERAYERARALNPQSAALHRARARCLLEQQKPESALAAARLSLESAPQDPEISQLVIEALHASGKRQEALRYAWSHVAVFPNDTGGWFLLSRLVEAPPGLSAQIQHHATERLPRQYRYEIVSPATVPARLAQPLDRQASARVDLEHGLATNDGRLIQRAARELRLNAVALLREAEALGAIEYAHVEANRAGSIVANDAALWQLRLRLSDLLQQQDEFELLLQQLPQPATAPNASDWGILRELLKRRTGIVPQNANSTDAQ